MTPRWHLRLFANLDIRCEQPIDPFSSTSQVAIVLAYLAYHAGTQSRDTLAEQIRPGVPPELGRPSLRVTLTELRARLHAPGDTLLVGGKTRIGLRPEAVSTDVDAFLADLDAAARTAGAARAAALSAALEHYRGPLLASFDQEWILGPREFLAARFQEALAQLVALSLEHNTLEPARRHLERALCWDALEEVRALLMEVELAAGHPEHALRQRRALIEARWRQYEQEMRDHNATLAQRPEPPDAPGERVEALTARARVMLSGLKQTRQRRVPDAARPQKAVDANAPGPAPCNLSPPLTPFFGHEAEITRLIAALQPDGPQSDTRLVTLTGPGGAGKTRLATEAGLCLRSLYADRVWLIPVADTDDPGRIVDLTADALIPDRVPHLPALTQLQQRIGEAPGLLILDNLEHLADTAAPLLSELLRALPSARACVTSRRPLQIQGERVYPLPPLPLPDAGMSPTDLARFACVELFLNRARNARPDFALKVADLATVAALCRQLDGYPLALELAASWAGTLSLSEMAERLKCQTDGLKGWHRDMPERHRSLRRALSETVGMLPAAQRRLLSQLAVFRGGWTLEAAEAVCETMAKAEEGAQTVNSLSVADALRDLSAWALIRAEEMDGAMRYRMLEPIREFALEPLSGETIHATATRHAAFYADLAATARKELDGRDRQLWSRILKRDQDNLAAAHAFLAASEQWRQAVELGGVLYYWQQEMGDTEASGNWIEKTVTLARQWGDPAAVCETLQCLGHQRQLFRPIGGTAAARRQPQGQWRH